MVRVICNDGDIDVNVHALRAASTVPGRALTRNDTAQLRLNTTRKGFSVLFVWLCHGKIEYSDGLIDHASELDDLNLLCAAYETGKILEIPPAFVDEVMDCIIGIVAEPTVRTTSEITDIVSRLRRVFGPDTAGRKFLVDWLVRSDTEDVEEDSGTGEAEIEIVSMIREDGDLLGRFLREIFHNKWTEAGRIRSWESDNCAYHTHGADRPCYAASGKMRT